MNEEVFEIYEFKFIDKTTKMGAVIYARTEETAMKIISLFNEKIDTYYWEKRRFRFKKLVYTSIPPYELEQEQFDCVNNLKRRSDIDIAND